MKKLCFIAVLQGILAISAFAQLDGNPENWCRNGAFPNESKNYYPAKVKGKKGARVYFYGDENNCPNGKNCRQKSYVIPGDEVIVSREFGKWSCVWYQPKKGNETVGWIASENLEGINLLQSIDEIIGKWNFYNNTIEISKTKKKDIYKVTGNAFWFGLNKNVHTGELDGEAKFYDDILKYGENDNEEYACKVSLNLVGRFLIVSDNLNCGGVNVTFSGVYQKSSRK